MISEKILQLTEALKREDSKQDLLDNINTCFQYLNIQMESSVSITMGDKSLSQIEMLNNKRNYAHDKMCEAMSEINFMAKEKGMEKIFDFELEPMQKNGKFVGYSQDNHYKTAGFCAIMADELLYLGRETYKTLKDIERLEENITEKVERKLIEKLSLEHLQLKLQEFEKEHFSLNTIMSLNDNVALEITFRDKTGSLTINPLDEYSVQVIESNLDKDSALLDYLDSDGTGEIPKYMLKDEISLHDGYNIVAYYELEKEMDILQQQAQEAISRQNIDINRNTFKKNDLEIER